MFWRLCAVRPGAALAVLCITTAVSVSSVRAQAPSASASLIVTLAPAHEHYRPRVEAAARQSIARYREWLGPQPGAAIRIDDGAGPDRGEDGITINLPWLAPPQAMEVESRVAFEIARRWWPGWAAQPQPGPMVDGLAWYLQSRVVPELYELAYQRPGHSAEAVRYFGSTVPWPIAMLTLGRWTAGLGRAEFLSGPRTGIWPGRPRRIPADADPMTARIALTFGSLERVVGWPALEAALLTLGAHAASGPMTASQVEQVVSAATGYSLPWFLTPALNPARDYAYAVGAVTTRPCLGSPCLRTEVVVTNRGTAAFTGTVNEPIGAYGSGDALELLVTFADGQSVVARWDGREASKTFAFDSATPPMAVELDPFRVLLLDRNHLDDSWRAPPPPEVAFAKWIAWWLIWVQDAALSYGGLI